MIAENESDLRQQMVDQCKWLSSNNFNQLTTGNIAVRLEPGLNQSLNAALRTPPCTLTSAPNMVATGLASNSVRAGSILITPSGQNYSSLTSKMIVKMNLTGDWECELTELTPSSEWRFHVDILKARPEINAVVHTHSMFATIQSMTRQVIPACHYLIAMLGGSDIRCAPYARFGSQELSEMAVAALDGRLACLLSNHGAIAIGKNLKQAIDNAVLLETLAQQYYYARISGVCLLTEQEIAATQQALEQLPGYGNR